MSSKNYLGIWKASSWTSWNLEISMSSYFLENLEARNLARNYNQYFIPTRPLWSHSTYNVQVVLCTWYYNEQCNAGLNCWTLLSKSQGSQCEFFACCPHSTPRKKRTLQTAKVLPQCRPQCPEINSKGAFLFLCSWNFTINIWMIHTIVVLWFGSLVLPCNR